jgi:hypothetical protein
VGASAIIQGPVRLRTEALLLAAAALLLAVSLFLPWSRSAGLDTLGLFGVLDEFRGVADGLERSAWEEWAWFDVVLAAIAAVLGVTATLELAGRRMRGPAIAAGVAGIVAVVVSFALDRSASGPELVATLGSDFVPAAAGPLLALAALGLALRALTDSGPPDLHERGAYALLVGAALLLLMAFAPWTQEPGVESHFTQDADSFSGGIAVWADAGGWAFEGTPWVASLFVAGAVLLVAAAERRARARSDRLGRRAAILAVAGAAVAFSPWLPWTHAQDLFDLDGWIVLGRTAWLLLLGGAAIALAATAPPHPGFAAIPAALLLLVALDGITVAGTDSSPHVGVFVLGGGLLLAFFALVRERSRTTL